LEDALKANDRQHLKMVLKQVVPGYKAPEEVNPKTDGGN